MTPFESIPIVTHDEISGEEKLRRVAKLVQDLRADLKEVNFLPHERNAAMEQLKVFGRNPANADPIFTREGIEILTRHSFHTTSPTTSKAALQCLANALLAVAPTRQIFVDLGYSPKAVARLKSPKKDDEFLMSRILFLTSYGTTQSFPELIDRHHLAEHINENLVRHAKRYSKVTPKKPPDMSDDYALSETLKLLFNITHFAPQRTPIFNKSLPSIFKIVAHVPATTSSALEPPLNLLINAILNFPMSNDAKRLLPGKSELRPAVARLLTALDNAFVVHPDADYDTNLIPLLTLLKHLACSSPPEIQVQLRRSLVPPSPHKPTKSNPNPSPDQPDSRHLSLKLLRHLRAPISTQLHDAISALLFEASGRNAEELGAGFGIGFSTGFPLGRNGQMGSVNAGYDEEVASLNGGEGSLSEPDSVRDSTASARPSHNRSSTQTSAGSSRLLIQNSVGGGRRGPEQSVSRCLDPSVQGGEGRTSSVTSGTGGLSPLPLKIGKDSVASGDGGERPKRFAATATAKDRASRASHGSDGSIGKPESRDVVGAAGLGVIISDTSMPPDDSRIPAAHTKSSDKDETRREDKDKVPEGYDIISETRKAWKGGLARAKHPSAASPSPNPAKAGAGMASRQRWKQQELPKHRDAVVVDEIVGPLTRRLSEMTVVMLDDR